MSWCCSGTNAVDSKATSREESSSTPNTTMAGILRMETECGVLDLRLRPDAAPVTVRYIADAVTAGLYDQGACNFYRSDFVIQCGLHESGRINPQGKLPVNETHTGVRVSNQRGTVSISHFDIPDSGSTEFFINLQNNEHLDKTYGGYCVFAEVANDQSMAVVDQIAKIIPKGTKPKVLRISLLPLGSTS